MNIKLRRPRLALAIIAGLAVVGCGSDGGDQRAGKEDGQHKHAAHGPHGGVLVELGSEEYHAEVLHDDEAGTVTVHILDSTAKSSVPITATEVTINLTHEGQAVQFKLPASPAEDEPPGKSSRFVSSEADLAEELDHDHEGVQLVVPVDGAQYRGAIKPHPDHAEHAP